jgi:hypothetical protein
MARIEAEVRIANVRSVNWRRRGLEFVDESSPLFILELLIPGGIFGEPHCTNTLPSNLGQKSLICTAEYARGFECLICFGKHKYADYGLWWSKKPRRSLSRTCLSLKELRENRPLNHQVRVNT